MIIGFAIFWLVLGLGVFLVAMRGGPRGTRQALHTESKASQRVVAILVVTMFVFGLGVPSLVLALNSADKASVGVGGTHLNGEQQQGRELFAHSCGVCHTLAAVKSVGRIGPNLDELIPKSGATNSSREAFVLSAIQTGFARGNGQMPALLYQGQEAKAIADFVAAVAGH
ncbi:MAG TPA: c-type cytochrome [Solirubrobacteraceae bacterium]|jgi:mono/diheme cytochrome c family protein